MPTEFRTNALVSLLRDHSPELLERLRGQFEDAASLRDGVELGPAAPTQHDPAIALAINALDVALQRVAPNETRLRERLHSAKRLRTTGATVAALTGAGIIAALTQDNPSAMALPTAVINFAGTLTTVYAGHLESALHGGEGSLSQTFETLVNTSVKAESLRDRLRGFQSRAPEEALVVAAIAEANDLAAELRRVERFLWGASASA